MVSFQLIRMLSYAKNKQQMCRVTQHQCNVAKCGKKFTNSPSTLTICLLKKKVVMTEQSIRGKVSTHKDVLLCDE